MHTCTVLHMQNCFSKFECLQNGLGIYRKIYVHINCLTSYNAYVCICCLSGQFSLCKALGDVHTYAASEENSFVVSWALS